MEQSEYSFTRFASHGDLVLDSASLYCTLVLLLRNFCLFLMKTMSVGAPEISYSTPPPISYINDVIKH